MPIEQVNAYKASDGKIFTDEREALDYEAYRQRYLAIEAWLEEYCLDGVDLNEIADILLKNGSTLKKYL